MTPEEKSVSNTKANADRKESRRPDCEERAEINFRLKIYDVIDNLKNLLRCNRHEQKQLLRFVDACYGMVDEAFANL